MADISVDCRGSPIEGANRMRLLFTSGSTAIALCMASGIFHWVVPLVDAQAPNSKNAAIDSIVRRLEQQERSVRSCECLLSYRSEPTPPKMIALIEEHCRKTGQSPDQYICTKDEAAQSTYVLHWWRQGVKERFDRFKSFEAMNGPGAKPVESEAFDGEFTRAFNTESGPNRSKGPVYCSIRSGKGALLTIDRYPFGFLYEYGDRRYSELLARARNARILEVDGQSKVVFSHFAGSPGFELVFGKDGSLLRRYKLSKAPWLHEPEPIIHERHSFLGYNTYRAASGESIRFPSEVDFEGVLNTTGDGQLIVTLHEHVQVNFLQFNHQIPDDVFVIQFPAGCVVHDQTARRARRPRQNAK
jgi:hypothetical protein